MTDYEIHHVRVDIEVIAKNQTEAENLVDKILHHAFIYGCGLGTYAQDHNNNYARVFDFDFEEEEE